MPKKLTTEEFIHKSKEVYGEQQYNYKDVVYVKSTVPVTLHCKCGNTFQQRPNNHLFGLVGCQPCANQSRHDSHVKSKQQYILDAQKVHGLKYDYSDIEYHRWDSILTIKCPYHSTFNQEANSHLQGSECPKCSRYKSSRKGGMSNIKDLDNESVHYYVVEFKNSKYHFIKVGLTTRSIEKRFKPKAYSSYTQIVHLDVTLPAIKAIGLERDSFITFKDEQYFISEKADCFKGCTELLNIKCLDKLLEFVNDRSSSHE